MKKKIILTALVLAVIGIIIASCAGGGEAKSSQPENVQVTTVDLHEPRTVLLTGSAVNVDSPDGQRQAVGGADGNIKVLDSQSGRVLHVFYAGGSIEFVRWSADGRYIHSNIAAHTALAEGYSREMYWDTQTGIGVSRTSVTDFQSSRSGASAKYLLPSSAAGEFLAWNSDGSRLVVGTGRRLFKENRAIIWDMASAAVTKTFTAEFRNPAEEMVFANTIHSDLAARMRSIAFAPDGNNVTMAMIGGVRTFNPDTGRTTSLVEGSVRINATTASYWSDVSTVYDGNETKFMYSPDGRTMLVMSGDEPSSRVYNVDVSWDVTRAVDLRPWGGTGIRDVTSIERAEPHRAPYNMRITLWDIAGSRQLYLLKEYDVYTMSSNAKTPLETFDLFRDAAFSPDGRTIAACGIKNVRIWDTSNGRVLRDFKLNDGYEIDRENVRIFEPDRSSSSLSFSRDGSLLAVGSYYDDIVLFNMRTNTELKQLSGIKKFIALVAVTPDNKQVMALSTDGLLMVWDIESGDIVKSLQIGAVTGINAFNTAFSPDRTRVALRASDTTVQVWDIASGEYATLAFYYPDLWVAAASSGYGWNASESGQSFIALVSEDGSAQNVSRGENNPGTLSAILTGRTDGLFDADKSRYAPVQQMVTIAASSSRNSAVYQPIQDGRYSNLSNEELKVYVFGSYACELRYIEVEDGIFSICLTTAGNIALADIFDQKYKQIRLTNLDTGIKYTPTGRRPEDMYSRFGRVFIDFSGVEGRRFSLTIPTKENHTFSEFVLGARD